MPFDAYRDSLTTGEWETEKESAMAFDEALAPSGLFRVYEEVPGFLLQPRPGTVRTAPQLRLDRVLIPTAKLRDLDWRYGAIGVEVKRSGVKIGPPLAQAMDYARCAWRVNGVLIHLGAVFLWPCAKQHSTVASLMAQNRVGSVHPSQWYAAYFQLGEETVLRVDHVGGVGEPYPGVGPVVGAGRSGLNVGSR